MKILEQAFQQKKIYRWPMKTWKDIQLNYLLGKCKLKPQEDITIVEGLKHKIMKKSNAGEDMENLDYSYIASGYIK